MQVNLPKAEAKALPAPDESVVVSIEQTGRIFVNSTEIREGDFQSKIRDIFAGRSKKEAFLKADRDVPYGVVVRTMAMIKGAGVERIGMVTEPQLTR